MSTKSKIILHAHESFHYLKLKRESGNREFGLKLDMNKAYDRVEWNFLEAALLKFVSIGIGLNWWWDVSLQFFFSIVDLNGNAGRFFTPKRRLRQADHLSPYLFLIISEVFSINITKDVKTGTL